MDHLSRVTAQSARNKMNSQNLAICFAPVLMLDFSQGQPVATNISEPIQILKYLIEIWPKSQAGLWNPTGAVNGNYFTAPYRVARPRPGWELVTASTSGNSGQQIRTRWSSGKRRHPPEIFFSKLRPKNFYRFLKNLASWTLSSNRKSFFWRKWKNKPWLCFDDAWTRSRTLETDLLLDLLDPQDPLDLMDSLDSSLSECFIGYFPLFQWKLSPLLCLLFSKGLRSLKRPHLCWKLDQTMKKSLFCFRTNLSDKPRHINGLRYRSRLWISVCLVGKKIGTFWAAASFRNLVLKKLDLVPYCRLCCRLYSILVSWKKIGFCTFILS